MEPPVSTVSRSRGHRLREKGRGAKEGGLGGEKLSKRWDGGCWVMEDEDNHNRSRQGVECRRYDLCDGVRKLCAGVGRWCSRDSDMDFLWGNDNDMLSPPVLPTSTTA
ncbi:reductive dehalogenase [Sesbania bispinosa]|nr:reductive dehalogenase [Sesbania bispinosa]